MCPSPPGTEMTGSTPLLAPVEVAGAQGLLGNHYRFMCSPIEGTWFNPLDHCMNGWPDPPMLFNSVDD